MKNKPDVNRLEEGDRLSASERMKEAKRKKGVIRMRKMLLTPLIVCMVALLSTLSMPAVHASTPISVLGTWSWMAPSADFKVIRVADGNIFISAVEHDIFDGTFVGTGVGHFTLESHPGVYPWGFATGHGEDHFTGKVLGKSGTLVIGWAGNTQNALGYWWCEWKILSGTDELANLHGQGTLWGPGPAGLDLWGSAEMSGTIVFAGP